MKFDRNTLTKDHFLLYAVTDRHWLKGRTLHCVVKESLDGGVSFIQLREKQLNEACFIEEAKDLKKLCHEYKVPFIINDNVDVALAIDADGVHVGQKDMEVVDVRLKLGPDNFINENITPIMKGITLLGSATFFIPFIIFLLIFIKNNYLRLSISINIILITLLNQTLKFVIQRPRPTQYRIVDASGYSFPSGHSMVSMAFYGFLIYLIYRYLKNKYLKTILILILSVVIVLIGISRIYLGVHYTSDVCAGFLLSLSYLIVYIHYIENWLNEKAAN